MTGLKDRQRLALYVALGLSAGSGLTLDASTAYANSDNHVTVLSTDPDFSTKYASGINATNETHSVKDNVVTIGRKSPVDTPAINGDVVGGYSNAYAVTHNTVTVDDMTLALAKSVFGGLADGDKAADDNEVTINGGTFAGSNAVYGGKSDTGTATNNTVTIAGGTFSNANVAGGAASTGTTSNHNRVVLGSDHGVYTADLSQADIWGTRYSGDAVVASGNAAITGNTLTVNAQNVTVNKVRNFEKYQFNLNQGVARDASMLTVADANGFGTGANVAWSNIEFSAKNWTDVKNGDGSHTHYGKSGVQTLIKTSDGNQHLVIHNETASSLTRTDLSGDFEYHLATDPPAAATVANGAVSVAKVTAAVNRIQNANAVYDATVTRPADADHAVRGGYSEYGHNVTKNTLKVTNLPATGLTAAYGGEVAGLAGEVFGNNLFVTGTNDHESPSATQTLTNAYGGAITNADNAGAVGSSEGRRGNRVAVSGGQVTNVYGGYTVGAGNVQGNAVANGNAAIAKSYGGYTTGTGTVQKNAVYVAGGTVTDAYGGASRGNGKVTENFVMLNGGTTGNAYGGYTTNGAVVDNRVLSEGGTATGTLYGAKTTSGNADDNKVFVRRGTVKNVIGAETTTGNVRGSQVFITGGTIDTPAASPASAVLGSVRGAQSADGNVDGNSVTITGGTIVGTVYGGAATGSGNVINNVVNLGDEKHHDLYDADLTAADLAGAKTGTGKASGNALNVYAKNADVKSVAKFDKYHFILDRAITDGATMLSVDAGGFGGESDWNNIAVEKVSAMMTDGDKGHNPGGRVVLAEGGAASNKLKIAGYTKRDYTTENTEHVIELDPDTLAEAAGAGNHATAESLLLTYAKFKDNTWTYDGATTSPTSEDNEVFGGISYLGHTTDNNVLTVTAVPDGGLAAAYGGKTAEGAANSKNNHVEIQGTAQQTSAAASGIDEIYGGYTASDYQMDGNIAVAGVAEGNTAKVGAGKVGNVYGGSADGEQGEANSNTAAIDGGMVTNVYGGLADGNNGKAQTNTATVNGGTVTNVYGGLATKADGTATGNKVFVYNGTTTNVYGGAVNDVTGAATKNLAEIRGGTVTGEITGARAVYDTTPAATHTLSNGNNVMLGSEEPTRALDMNVAGASIYGTDYRDVTSGVAGTPELTFDSASDQIKDNKLIVTTTGVSAKKVRNFDSYTFVLGDNFENKDTMLTLTEAGGFGTVSNALSNPAVKVDWGKVKANTSKLTDRRGGGIHGRNNFTLMQEAVPGTGTAISYLNELAFANYTDTAGIAEIDRVYEKKMTADGAPAAAGSTDRLANKVLLELNRFRNDEVTHDGTATPVSAEVYGGYSGYDHTERDKDGHDITVGTTTESNILNITGVANGTHDLKAFGGYSAGAHGGSVNNIVNVEVDELPNHVASGELYSVYGGYAKGANAGIISGNTVRFSQGATLKDLMGGYIDSTNLPAGTTLPTSDVVDNHVIITGGKVGGSYPHGTGGAAVDYVGSVYGGRTDGTGNARENTVYVNSPVVMSTTTPTERDATIIVDKMVGGYGATATDNDVTILSGTVQGSVYGGYATTAGTPETTGVSPTAEVSALRNNKVTLRDGVTVTGNVYGAYAAANASNMTAATDSNTIDLYKAVIDGTLYGGMAQDGTGHDVVSGKNNTLAIHARGAKADDFVGVQNLRFYVPEGTTAADKETMLTLNNVTHDLNAGGEKDLSNVHIGVALAGTRPSLKVGDAVSLMKVYEGNTTDAAHAVAITSDTPLVNKATGMQGISLRYNFDLLTREAEAGSGKNNELYATVTSASINPDTKSLAETRAASLAFLTSGSDLLTDAAMTAAMEVAATPASESQAGRARVDGAPKEYRMWAVQNVSSMRLNSGSHVDAKGWGLNLGFAKQRVSGRNTLTYGPFVEYGKGSYDSYLDDGLHGSGNMDYLGVGVMAKSQSENGAYVEGSVRVGRVKSDYAGTIDNTHTTYDSSSTYYAGHLGVGQEKQLKNGNVIDTYAKYFFTHQGGDTAKLSTGEVYDFDAADSHRIRFGTRYTSKKGDASFYTGLAYEYEFGNDIAASFEGYNTPSPSLTGGTGILELGYRFTPQNGRATYGIQLMGMTGKRRGISGGVQMHWAF